MNVLDGPLGRLRPNKGTSYRSLKPEARRAFVDLAARRKLDQPTHKPISAALEVAREIGVKVSGQSEKHAVKIAVGRRFAVLADISRHAAPGDASDDDTCDEDDKENKSQQPFSRRTGRSGRKPSDGMTMPTEKRQAPFKGASSWAERIRGCCAGCLQGGSQQHHPERRVLPQCRQVRGLFPR